MTARRIRKYHTLGKPTLTVPIGPPVSSDRAEVPAGALLLRGSEPSRCGHPYESRLRFFCSRSRSKRRLSLNLCSEILRDGVTLLGRACFPYTCSIVTKDRFSCCFQLPPTYACTRMHLGRGGEPTSSIKSALGLWSKQGTSPHANGLELKACS